MFIAKLLHRPRQKHLTIEELKHIWSQTYFKKSAGQFVAILQMLHLNWSAIPNHCLSNKAQCWETKIPSSSLFIWGAWHLSCATIVIGWCVCSESKSSQKKKIHLCPKKGWYFSHCDIRYIRAKYSNSSWENIYTGIIFCAFAAVYTEGDILLFVSRLFGSTW